MIKERGIDKISCFPFQIQRYFKTDIQTVGPLLEYPENLVTDYVTFNKGWHSKNQKFRKKLKH